MTQRERHASGGVVEAPPRPTAGQVAASRASASSEPNTNRAPLWEETFRGASSAQKLELLALASKQGVLYSHQLPPSNGNQTDSHRHLLSALLRGDAGELQPVRLSSISLHDSDLDDNQREAV